MHSIERTAKTTSPQTMSNKLTLVSWLIPSSPPSSSSSSSSSSPLIEPNTHKKYDNDRVDVIIEFLEAAVHHVLHARGLYPKELFEARKVFGARVQKARHPDLESYVEGAVYALRAPIARGDVKRVVLVIKDGDAGGAGNPLERFTFDFLLHAAFLRGAEKPTRADVDEVARSFAACMAKISFLDAVLPPLPSGGSGCTFELVAYATRAGLSQ